MTDEGREVQAERRSDRRISMQGRVHIVPRRRAASVAAELIDVSAGGLRAETSPPMALTAGSAVDVEIRMAKEGPQRLDVTFRGAAVVLRLDGAGDRVQATLQFIDPLELREPFSHLAVEPPSSTSTR